MFTAPGTLRRHHAGSARTFETDLAEFNIATNHVHLPVNSPPEVALSRLVNSPKDVPSRRLRQEYPELRQPCRKANRL